MLHLNEHSTARHISSCLQLAILLEVSAPKPGNVNRMSDFPSTRYEHFLASAIAVGPSFEEAAQRGAMVFNKEIQPSKLFLGKTIKSAVTSVNAWQHGGNTLLGSVLLLSPIAAAAGMVQAEERDFSSSELRSNVRVAVESTTPSDAVAVYNAIKMVHPSGLVGKAPTLDVNDPSSIESILRGEVTLHDVFQISAPYDSVSREWVENYPITFEIGLPYFVQQLEDAKNLNTAIVHTFLRVLSTVPDTLIIRKAGLEQAKEISESAGEILDLGGLTTSLGRDQLSLFDEQLRKTANQQNPGTTADIIAAVLAVSILNGYRP
jgi:triphosphoribosyl-dephospho-CoA synthase